MSKTPRIYKDADGQPISLYRLIRNDPAWAENQILHRDKLEVSLAEAHKLLLKTNQTFVENQKLQRDLDGEREINQRLTDELAEARAYIERKDALIKQMLEALENAKQYTVYLEKHYDIVNDDLRTDCGLLIKAARKEIEEYRKALTQGVYCPKT